MLMKSLFLDLSSKFLKNTVISPLNFYHFFLLNFSTLKLYKRNFLRSLLIQNVLKKVRTLNTIFIFKEYNSQKWSHSIHHLTSLTSLTSLNYLINLPSFAILFLLLLYPLFISNLFFILSLLYFSSYFFSF